MAAGEESLGRRQLTKTSVERLRQSEQNLARRSFAVDDGLRAHDPRDELVRMESLATTARACPMA